ncbi:DUF3343 domain-containing protein [Anaerostipes sp. MSJ-23]|uniref:DUF3343 domain-containing protein n=1 Tax=unclassified Anaerostipes TaxID=2635253 RepID=UPI001C11002C|nr:DUF3343 domain-containing protein [Anaerostipes sp. MSJ-23]MBU5460679.1 DUF3343 domain-containing protein [Anaerostipes sp. MSJ-23]
MRKKIESVIISFESTTQAMKMDKFCMEHHLPGRLIPVPREITAGCGLAWKALPEEKEQLKVVMEEQQIIWQEIYIMKV